MIKCRLTGAMCDEIRRKARRNGVLLPALATAAGMERTDLNRIFSGQPVAEQDVIAVMKAAKLSGSEMQRMLEEIAEATTKAETKHRIQEHGQAFRGALSNHTVVRFFDEDGTPVAIGLHDVLGEDENGNPLQHAGYGMDRWPAWLKIGHHVRVLHRERNRYPIIKHIVSFLDPTLSADCPSIGVILDYSQEIQWKGRWPAAPVDDELGVPEPSGKRTSR